MLNIKKYRKSGTPIADFLLANRDILNASFHALPISTMKPGTKSYDKYKELFGSRYFSTESTVTGRIFDSFFYPTKCIKKAQDYTAELFGANDTLFVTCGTSISNQIVIDALISETSHVLLDRQSHQSMHFGASSKKATIDYFYSKTYCSRTDRNYLSIEDILLKVKTAQENNHPYDVIILTASSYDGVICNVYEIIKQIIKISPNIQFIIDEAWSSAFYFNEKLHRYTAGYAASQLKNKVDIIATQSAHKSLMTLRQASYIHSFASADVTQNLYRSRFKLHSTSPNYAILASMDLARAQMQSCGNKMLAETLEVANYIRDALNDPELSAYILHDNSSQNLEQLSGGVCVTDPLKIHLCVKHLGMNGSDIQEYLYQHHGIYFNRYTEDALLLNIHIGVTKYHADLLLASLKDLNFMKKNHEIGEINVRDFVISYPPGIPMHAPGEIIRGDIYSEIFGKRSSGINVFRVA